MIKARKITINPISRLEGHGKVVIHLDAHGEVEDARFHVTQFRGYERFCEGRPLEEMPVITQRICGICPVSHQLASAKACDAILGVEIPETAKLLRELQHMGQFIQSHALHFFHLASPDLLLGWDSDPAKRNVVGIIGEFPEVARKGIRLRKFGQDIIKVLGGKKVHPVYAVPGGVMNPLYQKYPKTWLVSVQGDDFGFGEGLSPECEVRARRAALEIASFVSRKMVDKG